MGCREPLLENKQYQQLSPQPSVGTVLNFMTGICLLAALGERFKVLRGIPFASEQGDHDQCVFSLPDVASCSALLTSPQFLHGRRVRAEDGATISGRTVSHYRILEKLGGGGMRVDTGIGVLAILDAAQQ